MATRLGRDLALVLIGLVGWLVVAVSAIPRDGVVLWVLLMMGPAWAYSSCWLSTDDEYPEDAGRRRDEWLRVLPWTFVLAPLVVPNLVLLTGFFRDSRADHGLTLLGSGRSRPGEGQEEVWR